MARSDGKRLGRRCERRAQSVVLEKQSVRHDGNCFRSGTWVEDSWVGRTRVSRISPWLGRVSFLDDGATAVCGTVMVLSSQEVAISLEAREI